MVICGGVGRFEIQVAKYLDFVRLIGGAIDKKDPSMCLKYDLIEETL
jgi:hypothetical protein